MKKLINTDSAGYLLASGALSYGTTILSEAIISGMMDTLFVPKATKTARILTRIGKSGIMIATIPAVWRSWWRYIDSAAETINTLGNVASQFVSIRTVNGEAAEAIRTILAEKDTADKEREYKQESQKNEVDYHVGEMLDETPVVNESVDAPTEEE